MIHNMFIISDDVLVLGEEEQDAEIIVDLSNVWNQIASHYTRFYAIGQIQVPTLEEDEAGNIAHKMMKLKINQVFKVDEVVEQQVILKSNYSGLIKEDTMRSPTAQVKLIAYTVDEVEGNSNA